MTCCFAAQAVSTSGSPTIAGGFLFRFKFACTWPSALLLYNWKRKAHDSTNSCPVYFLSYLDRRLFPATNRATLTQGRFSTVQEGAATYRFDFSRGSRAFSRRCSSPGKRSPVPAESGEWSSRQRDVDL